MIWRTRTTLTTAGCLLAILSTVCLSPAAAAQPTDDDIGEMATFLTLFPELRQLPAPEFLTPSTRVSYGASGATSGSGGAGIIQYDVVSRSAARVVAHQHSYGDGGAGLIPYGQTIAQGLPGVGPFWINPSVLNNADRVASPTLTVSRYDKQVAGTTRTVVRFQTQTSTGRTVYEFSAASGLLVFSSVSGPGGAAQLELLAARTLNLPWTPDAAPRWARPGTQLNYVGVRNTDINAMNQTQQQVQVSMSVRDATNAWSILDSVVTLQGLGQSAQTTAVGVAQMVGAVWLPRGALSAQLPNQPTMIDRDPLTGAEVFVRRDAEQIVLQQELDAAIITWMYDDRLGVLERQVERVQTPQTFVETDLALTGGSDLAALDELPSLPDESDSGSGNGPGGDPSGSGSDSAGCAAAGSTRPPASAWALLGLSLLLLRRSRRRG